MSTQTRHGGRRNKSARCVLGTSQYWIQSAAYLGGRIRHGPVVRIRLGCSRRHQDCKKSTSAFFRPCRESINNNIRLRGFPRSSRYECIKACHSLAFSSDANAKPYPGKSTSRKESFLVELGVGVFLPLVLVLVLALALVPPIFAES